MLPWLPEISGSYKKGQIIRLGGAMNVGEVLRIAFIHKVIFVISMRVKPLGA